MSLELEGLTLSVRARAPARGFALYIPQDEFPASQPLGGRTLSPSFHARHFEYEDEHVHEHEHEEYPFRNSL